MSTVAGATARNGRAAVFTLVYLGFCLQLLQAGIVPLIPVFGEQLHLSTFQTSWLLTAGLLSGVVVLAVVTRLADMVGKRAMILWCLVAVLIGAAMCCFSTDYTVLLIGRILMGAQLPMLALPEALASDTMDRGRAQVAIAATHAGVGVGVAGGIVLAALVGANPSAWRVYFYIGVLVSVLGLLATLLFVRESPHRARGGLDVRGTLVLTVALVAGLLGLSRAPDWGWTSVGVLALLAVCVLLLIGWFQLNRRSRYPLIHPRYLAMPQLRVAYLVSFLVAFGVYGAISAFTRYAVADPAKVGYGWHFTTLGTAWFGLPQALANSVCVTLVVVVARGRRHALATAVGALLCMFGYLGFAVLRDLHGGVLIAVGVYALGTGVALAGAQLLIVRAVPAQESAIALGVSIMMYAIGQSLGTDIDGVIFRSWVQPGGAPTVQAFLLIFSVSAGASLLAVLLSLSLVRRRRAAALVPALP